MKAKRVVVLVWEGGVRASETILDPARRWVPRIWGELVPCGTLLTRLYNDGWTNHGPSLQSLATGRWETRGYIMPAYDPEGCLVAEARRRGRETLVIFPGEAARGAILSGGDESCVVRAPLTPEPAGEIYPYRSYDLAVVREFLARGPEWPDLVFLVFDDTDAAHGGRWSWYTAAIRNADELTASLWEKLKGADTDFLVLPIFGRAEHGETRTGFMGHGRDDEGSARQWMLALGPDFAAGRVVDRRARLIDVAPTIARILGMRFRCRGRILREIFA